MSIQTDFGVIPEFTQGDRLRKARELTGLDIGQFADEIGVSRNTVSNAELDKVRTRKIMLKAWALRTGVPLEWLESGTTKPRPGGPDGAVDEECAIRDSNPEPADLSPQIATLLPLRVAA